MSAVNSSVEIRTPGLRRQAEERLPGHVQGTHLGRRQGLQHRPIQWHIWSIDRHEDVLPLRQLARIYGTGNLVARIRLHRRIRTWVISWARRHLRFKGQTRLWGYNVGKPNAENELTALRVESDRVKDKVDDAEGTVSRLCTPRLGTPGRRQRDSAAGKSRVDAPDGEVNKVLETVITNLEVTNNLDIEPEVAGSRPADVSAGIVHDRSYDRAQPRTHRCPAG